MLQGIALDGRPSTGTSAGTTDGVCAESERVDRGRRRRVGLRVGTLSPRAVGQRSGAPPGARSESRRAGGLPTACPRRHDARRDGGFAVRPFTLSKGAKPDSALGPNLALERSRRAGGSHPAAAKSSAGVPVGGNPCYIESLRERSGSNERPLRPVRPRGRGRVGRPLPKSSASPSRRVRRGGF